MAGQDRFLLMNFMYAKWMTFRKRAGVITLAWQGIYHGTYTPVNQTDQQWTAKTDQMCITFTGQWNRAQ
jgi:hypothetical protein